MTKQEIANRITKITEQRNFRLQTVRSLASKTEEIEREARLANQALTLHKAKIEQARHEYTVLDQQIAELDGRLEEYTAGGKKKKKQRAKQAKPGYLTTVELVEHLKSLTPADQLAVLEELKGEYSK